MFNTHYTRATFSSSTTNVNSTGVCNVIDFHRKSFTKGHERPRRVRREKYMYLQHWWYIHRHGNDERMEYSKTVTLEKVAHGLGCNEHSEGAAHESLYFISSWWARGSAICFRWLASNGAETQPPRPVMKTSQTQSQLWSTRHVSHVRLENSLHDNKSPKRYTSTCPNVANIPLGRNAKTL